ncbi:MAG: glycosyltransferase family 39 protein [Solirubrobacteraceae bacterium]
MSFQARAAPSRRSTSIRALLCTADGQPHWDRVGVGAVIAGALLRALFVFVLHSPHDYVYSDMRGYLDRAMQVLHGGAVPRSLALEPPGAHLLLAGPLELFGTGVTGLRWADALWFGFSALVPLFAWRWVRQLLGPVAGAITAALCAAAPLFVLYAGFFTSETPSMALLAGALWLGYRAGSARPWAGLGLGVTGGLLGGALVATRPQFILNLALVFIPLVRNLHARWRAAAGFAFGLIAVIAAIVAVNSSHTGHLTGISENSGLTFFQAQCNIHDVVTGRPPGPSFEFGNPVAAALARGRNVRFPNHIAWDQGFFYRQGLECIGTDGVGQVFILARELVDLTATSIPWPFSNEIALSRIGDIANTLYSVALLIVIALVLLARRRSTLDERTRSGTATLLAHLAMAAPVAVVFGSEPRYRVPYDIFGLALMAWLIAVFLRTRGGQATTAGVDAAASP